MATPEADNERMRQVWGRVAPGWGARSEVIEAGQDRTTRWLLAQSDPQPGDVVLDLAGGAGGLGRLAADLVGPEGRVVATDFAPEMVDVARRLGDARGLRNLDYRVLDGQHMDLEDDSVDVVLCRSGIMLMLDPGAALREARRVLRPDGRLAFSVFTSADENPWASTSLVPFVQRGYVDPPEPGGPGMFALGDEQLLRRLISDAGFASATVEAVADDHVFADDDDLWHLASDINALLSPIVSALAPAERDAMRRAVIDAHEPWRSEDGSFRLPGRVFGAFAC